MENIKITAFCLVALLAMVIGVIFFNRVSKEEKIDDVPTEKLEYNNVAVIDAKLGSDIKITQSYLLNYITKKSGIWYQSNGKVTKIIYKDEDCYIHLKDDNSAEVLIAVIDKSKCEVKVGDSVNFVGTIDIENGQIKLSKISTEEINYNSSTKLELNELIDNIKLVKNTYFIVSGYLVTEGEVYKLFDSKDDYTENNKAGYYFKIKWDGSFGYTGKQQVSLKCNLSSSYTLVNCTLSE